jgi:hypothetical protein
MTETVTYPCGCSATGTAPIPRYCPDHPEPLRELVKEASEILQITYAGNFPAGIESFLVRAAAALSGLTVRGLLERPITFSSAITVVRSVPTLPPLLPPKVRKTVRPKTRTKKRR